MPSDTLPFQNQQFVAFVDMLGYKSLVFDKRFTENQRFDYLHSVFMALAQAARDCTTDFEFSSSVKAVQFSDSFYFSSESAVAIVTTVANFFANVYSIYDQTLPLGSDRDDNSFAEWLPFLRGAITYDWMFEGFDITLPDSARDTDKFRNPIGPAIAKAYLLGEKTGVEGMRCAVTEQVKNSFEAELPLLSPSTCPITIS